MGRTKLLHVIPALTIGGVETGIYRSREDLIKIMEYEVFSVKGRGTLPLPCLSWGRIFKRMARRQDAPDVVVSSLWLGHLVGGFLAIAFGARWIPFFHVARSEGLLRDLVLQSAARLSRFAFFDSEATQRYYGTHTENSSQIIPYRFGRALPPGFAARRRHYDCVFVGRLSQQKRPDLLVSYLKYLQQMDPGIRPLILVSADESRLKQFGDQLQVSGVVADVRANVDPLDVVSFLDQSSLYISLSDYEGFSMSTVDAMSSGCVPVVRPVGEIASDVDRQCGILVTDTSPVGLEKAAAESLKLLASSKALQAVSGRARRSVDRYRLYTEAYLDGIQRALSQP